jgi:hypothetical protein
MTERAIHGEFAGLRREDGENLRDHDGPVRASGRFAGGENFGDGGVVLAVLFVFVGEAARIFAGVTDTAFMRRRIGGNGFGHARSFWFSVADFEFFRRRGGCVGKRRDAGRTSEITE